MGKLILVRHGESEGNRDRMFAVEPRPLPLTELGYRQAREAGEKIACLFKPCKVVASNYLRAHETARVIAERFGMSVDTEDQLHEREVGELRGRSYDSIRSSPDYDPQRFWAWTPKGGESFLDVSKRVVPIIHRLAQMHLGRDVVVVSHGGVMKTLWAHFTGDWHGAYTPPNCGIVLVEHSAQGYGQPTVVGEWAGADHTGG